MTTNDRAVKEFYTDGKMNTNGFKHLSIMFELMLKHNFDIVEVRKELMDNHNCSPLRATDLFRWANDKLTA